LARAVVFALLSATDEFSIAEVEVSDKFSTGLMTRSTTVCQYHDGMVVCLPSSYH